MVKDVANRNKKRNNNSRRSVVPAARPEPTDVELITPKELEQLLKVSRSTVDRLVRSGADLGKVVIGGQIRYQKHRVVQWIQAQNQS